MPRPAIHDQFSHIPCKQRRWQLRKEAQGCCRLCGERAVKWGYCLPHAEKQATFTKSKPKLRQLAALKKELEELL